MKRIKRRVFNALALLSALLCLAALALWVRSYWRTHFIFWRGADDRGFVLMAATGRINLEWSTHNPHNPSLVLASGAPLLRVLSGPPYDYRIRVYREERRAGSDIRRGWNGGGFSWFSHASGAARWWWVSLPCWAVTLAAAILPVCRSFGRAAEWNRRRRQRNGLCLSCGYDLRASKDRCPECGEAVPAGRAASVGANA